MKQSILHRTGIFKSQHSLLKVHNLMCKILHLYTGVLLILLLIKNNFKSMQLCIIISCHSSLVFLNTSNILKIFLNICGSNQ